jgi:hypothetical protein
MQVDTYIKPTLAYPNAKVAAVLCKGGPCKYVMKEGSGSPDAWILQYVVPHIAQRFSPSVALVLGRPLLWVAFAFKDFGVLYLPQALHNRIQTAYTAIIGGQLEPGENPVKKVLMVITGMKEKYTSTILANLGNGNNDDGNGKPPRRRQLRGMN